MVKNQDQKKKAPEKEPLPADDQATVPVVLTSKQEIADELKMSPYQFDKLVRRYPFSSTGVPGKINGRWRITQEDAWNWFRYVQRQELRHPDARRMRPEEAPELSEIRGR